jgi:hypothetical protein
MLDFIQLEKTKNCHKVSQRSTENHRGRFCLAPVSSHNHVVLMDFLCVP